MSSPLPNIGGESGQILVAGAKSITEDNIVLDGQIATCVECSAIMLAHVVAGTPLTSQSVISMTQWLQARGEASPNGASYYTHAADYLSSVLHIGTTPYNSAWMAGNNWQSLLEQQAGQRPVMLGFHNAWALRDDWTGTYWNRGVYGHACCLLGKDSTGFIVGDPNSGPSRTGGFVHYTAANLQAAGLDSLLVSTAAPGSIQGSGSGGGGSTGSGGTSTTLDALRGLTPAQQLAYLTVNEALSSQATYTVQQLSGIHATDDFLALCTALDESAQLPAMSWDWNPLNWPQDIFNWLLKAAEGIGVRLVFIAIGLIILVAFLVHLLTLAGGMGGPPAVAPQAGAVAPEAAEAAVLP